MQKQAPTVGRLLVMVGFALSCFGLLLFLWLAFGGAIPLQSKGYRVTVPFREAGQLALEADVRISGVRVGKVKSIDLNRDTNTTDAVVEIDSKYAPIAADSQALLRQKTLLGETYIEMTAGTPGSKTVPENGRLRVGNVDQSVELDEIFRALDKRTREDFKIWMQRQAQAIGGRGRDVSDAFGTLVPLTEDATDLLTVLNSQEGAVSRLVRNTGEVFTALSERDSQLQQLIVNSNNVWKTTAQRDNELRQIFQILPTFETESTITLARLERFARQTNPLITQLRPAARELTPTLQSLQVLAPDLKALFRDLGPLITASKKGLPALDQFLRNLEPLLGQFDPFLRQVNPALEGLGFYKKELNAFFANVPAATQAVTTPIGSASFQRLHYLRTLNPFNPENLAFYPRRIGSNRPNAYQFPTAFNRLANPGYLQVFEERGCGNGIPTLISAGALAGGTLPTGVLPGVLPEQLPTILPDQLRNLIDQFAFKGGSGIPAPPCERQPKFPSLGAIDEQTDYPHVYPDAPTGRR